MVPGRAAAIASSSAFLRPQEMQVVPYESSRVLIAARTLE